MTNRYFGITYCNDDKVFKQYDDKMFINDFFCVSLFSISQNEWDFFVVISQKISWSFMFSKGNF